MMLRVKDFAAQQGVSESIVYRHIRQHREELGENVIKKAKATWLTDEGQDFIRNRMVQQPLVLQNNPPELEELRDQVRDLKTENKEQAAANRKLIVMLEASQAENKKLTEKAARVDLLEAGAAEHEKQLSTAHQETEKEKNRADQAEEENSELRRKLEEAENQIKAMKGRGLLARILRKGE